MAADTSRKTIYTQSKKDKYQMTPNTKQAINQAKKNLSSEGGKLATMLDPCQLIDQENGTVKLMAQNEYDAKWLTARATKLLQQQLMGILDQKLEIIFEAPPEDQDPLPQGETAVIAPAYGESKAAIIQPNQLIVQTRYFFHEWKPLLGKTPSDVVLAARSLCYWNPRTGEKRSQVSTDRAELAKLACCSEKSVTRSLKKDLVRKYFIRSKIARTMTSEGSRNLGLNLWVRMDDPLTPEDQEKYQLDEPTTWQLFGG